MPDIREIVKALSEDDNAAYRQARNDIRACYLAAHNHACGLRNWSHDDDAFFDLIDIKLATLFDRGGKLKSEKADVTGKDDAPSIEKQIEEQFGAIGRSATDTSVLPMNSNEPIAEVSPPNGDKQPWPVT